MCLDHLRSFLDYFYRTWFLILVGCLSGLVYLFFRWRKGKKLEDEHLLNFGSVAFNSLSVIGGLRLCGGAFKTAYDTNQVMDMNNMYTVYGGIVVIWLSVKTINKKYSE